MTQFQRLVLSIVILTFPALDLARSDDGDPQGLFIRMDGELLTVRAMEVPHRLILEGLARRLGFELILSGPLEERRSLELQGKPWEEALKEALLPASWAFVYESTAGRPRLAKVFVLPSNKGTGPPSSSSSPPESMPAQEAREKGIPFTADQKEKLRTVLSELFSAQGFEVEDKEAIRRMAEEAFSGVGSAQALKGLQQALRHEGEVKQTLEEALGRLMQTPQK